MRNAVGCCFVLAAIAAGGPARADGGARSEDAKTEAIARFKRGLELYQEGDLRPALSEFRKAYALAPMYRVHFNIGQVCFELKEYACALTSFEAYLKQGGDAIPPARKAAIRADIGHLALRVANLVVAIAEPGAEVTIDDVVVGTTPIKGPIVVSAGRRKVSAQRPGGQSTTRIVDLAGAETVTISMVLPATAAPLAPLAPRSAPPARWTTISFAGVGVAGALTAGAVITGVLARTTSDAAQATKFAGTSPPSDVIEKRDRAFALAIASDVLAVTAGATLAATLIGTYVRKVPTKERAEVPRVRVGASLSAVVVEGSF